MSTPNTLSKPAAIRRTRYAIQSAALLFAITTVCVLVGILADRFPHRFDATATREHRLSERTQKLLASLDGDYELVVVANFSTLDPQAARRTQDVLDNFSHASTRLRSTVIDAASAQGAADLDALLGRLVVRFKPDLDKQAEGLSHCAVAVARIAKDLHTFSDTLHAMSQSVLPDEPKAAEVKTLLGDWSTNFEIAAKDIAKAAGKLADSTSTRIGRTPVPANDELIAGLRAALSASLETVGKTAGLLENMSQFKDEKIISPALRESARDPAATAAAIRTGIGHVIAALDELPRTPLASIVRVVEHTSAAIMIGPPMQGRTGPGVTSIDLASIYPLRSSAEPTVRVDLRARTEELLAAALASVSAIDPPIVVVVHGQSRRIAPEFRPLQPVIDRLGLRGVDFAEWAAGLDAEQPPLKSIDPSGKRPVVYLVTSLSPSAGDEGRYAKLIDATARLISDGRNVLLCEVPSASLGATDPMADMLKPLGVQLDSARTLLHQRSDPRGRTVSPDITVIDPQTDHPIAGAFRGLELCTPWTSPLVIAPDAKGVRAVVKIDSQGQSVWAESEWLAFWQTPPQQRPLLVDPPAPGGSRDDAAGPWPIVASIERAAGSSSQRIVVVGSTNWLSIGVIGAEVDVEGRRVPAYPGNMELLDASISWLAGQDSMISTSPSAQAVPLIPPLAVAKVSAMKWGLIGGLPILILLVGAIWRLLRG